MSEQGCGSRETLKQPLFPPGSVGICLGQVPGGHRSSPAPECGFAALLGGLQGLASVLWIASVYRVCIATFPSSVVQTLVSLVSSLFFTFCWTQSPLGCASLPRVHARGQGCLQASVRAGSGSCSELPGMRQLWNNERAGAFGILPGWVGSGGDCHPLLRSSAFEAGRGRVTMVRRLGLRAHTPPCGPTGTLALPKYHPLTKTLL